MTTVWFESFFTGKGIKNNLSLIPLKSSLISSPQKALSSFGDKIKFDSILQKSLINGHPEIHKTGQAPGNTPITFSKDFLLQLEKIFGDLSNLAKTVESSTPLNVSSPIVIGFDTPNGTLLVPFQTQVIGKLAIPILKEQNSQNTTDGRENLTQFLPFLANANLDVQMEGNVLLTSPVMPESYSNYQGFSQKFNIPEKILINMSTGGNGESVQFKFVPLLEQAQLSKADRLSNAVDSDLTSEKLLPAGKDELSLKNKITEVASQFQTKSISNGSITEQIFQSTVKPNSSGTTGQLNDLGQSNGISTAKIPKNNDQVIQQNTSTVGKSLIRGSQQNLNPYDLMHPFFIKASDGNKNQSNQIIKIPESKKSESGQNSIPNERLQGKAVQQNLDLSQENRNIVTERSPHNASRANQLVNFSEIQAELEQKSKLSGVKSVDGHELLEQQGISQNDPKKLQHRSIHSESNSELSGSIKSGLIKFITKQPINISNPSNFSPQATFRAQFPESNSLENPSHNGITEGAREERILKTMLLGQVGEDFSDNQSTTNGGVRKDIGDLFKGSAAVKPNKGNEAGFSRTPAQQAVDTHFKSNVSVENNFQDMKQKAFLDSKSLLSNKTIFLMVDREDMVKFGSQEKIVQETLKPAFFATLDEILAPATPNKNQPIKLINHSIVSEKTIPVDQMTLNSKNLGNLNSILNKPQNQSDSGKLLENSVQNLFKSSSNSNSVSNESKLVLSGRDQILSRTQVDFVFKEIDPKAILRNQLINSSVNLPIDSVKEIEPFFSSQKILNQNMTSPDHPVNVQPQNSKNLSFTETSIPDNLIDLVKTSIKEENRFSGFERKEHSWESNFTNKTDIKSRGVDSQSEGSVMNTLGMEASLRKSPFNFGSLQGENVVQTNSKNSAETNPNTPKVFPNRNSNEPINQIAGLDSEKTLTSSGPAELTQTDSTKSNLNNKSNSESNFQKTTHENFLNISEEGNLNPDEMVISGSLEKTKFKNLSLGSAEKISSDPLISKQLKIQSPSNTVGTTISDSIDFISSLSKQFYWAVKNRTQEIFIQLRPEHLGLLKIKLRMDEDRLSGRVEVYSTEVHQLLTKHAKELHQRLLELNISMDSLDFDLMDTSKENQSENSHRGAQRSSKSGIKYEHLNLNSDEVLNRKERVLGYNTFEYIA